MHLKKFEELLKSVDLSGYRNKFNPIKIVEMDLPPEIQAISVLYEVYWDKKEFVDYESFYQKYLAEYKKKIEKFRKKIGMCRKCFYKGLPARIYRTWASIITQIHAGYVAESVFADGTVKMSVELDHKGADFRVEYNGKKLNYQVKKESYSREVRQGKKAKKQLDGKFITISYKVPDFEMIKNPRLKNGSGFKKAYTEFKKDYLDTGILAVLDNGFVVFTPLLFEKEKAEIDALKKR